MFSLFKKKGPPDAAAVIRRFSILRYFFLKARVLPPPELLAFAMDKWDGAKKQKLIEESRTQFAVVVQQVKEAGLWADMNSDERNFMQAGMREVDRQALLDASWLAEPLACLGWALNNIARVPPYDQQVDPKTFEDLFKEPLTEILPKVSLRSAEEIREERDLADLWHWRSRTRQLQESGRMPARIGGKLTMEEVIQMSSTKAAENGAFPAPIGHDFPTFGKPYREASPDEFSTMTSISMERHRAFNWLCGYAPSNRWYETPTET